MCAKATTYVKINIKINGRGRLIITTGRGFESTSSNAFPRTFNTTTVLTKVGNYIKSLNRLIFLFDLQFFTKK